MPKAGCSQIRLSLRLIFVQTFMKKNIIISWIEAARPKTLTASISPVVVACALALHDGVFNFIPALLCLAVAVLAQIASNFANDYFDFRKGADREDRLGPERAVASGWIAPKVMLIGTFITLALACLSGCMLLFFAGWELIPVGVAIAICVLAYSAGPFPLAYNGLGDVCVLLFYGIVPVCFTYYVQALTFTMPSLLLALSLGFLSINILVVNNYRDYFQDRKSNKHTTIVLFGRTFGRVFYLINGTIAITLTTPFLSGEGLVWKACLLLAFYILFLSTWRELSNREGKALNKTLGNTARNVFIFTLYLTVVLLF